MNRDSSAPCSSAPREPAARTPAPLPAAAREELEKLYREADAEILGSGARCWLRGQCCDFERNDHRLYASSLEIAYVQERYPEPFSPGSVLCPFWRDGMCGERERRPLGCRSYFCDPRHGAKLEEIYEKYHRRIRRICERHAIPYRYEPFVAALRGEEQKLNIEHRSEKSGQLSAISDQLEENLLLFSLIADS